MKAASATATLAAKLATLPATSNAHGSIPPRRPDRESASNVVDAARIIPSTDKGVSAATQPGCPCSATSMCIWKVGDRARDQLQQCHAANRGPPAPPIGPGAHREPRRTSSPVIAGMYVPGDSFLGHIFENSLYQSTG